MSRLLLGQSANGTLQYVSHVRTWYLNWTRCTFEIKGSRECPSFTISTVRSLSRHFRTTMTSIDDRRAPITLQELNMLVRCAVNIPWYDLAAAMVIAWCAMCRFGELTNDGRTPFSPAFYITETSVEFVPSFSSPTHVVLHLGRTKADQQGVRDRLFPKILPVTDAFLSPGRWLKILMSKRYPHRVPHTWALNPQTPLFLSRNGGSTVHSHSIHSHSI